MSLIRVLPPCIKASAFKQLTLALLLTLSTMKVIIVLLALFGYALGGIAQDRSITTSSLNTVILHNNGTE